MHKVNLWRGIVSFIFIFILIFGGHFLFSQTPQEVGGMKVSWEFEGERLFFELIAPDNGWVGLGFNAKDDIVGTHLLLFSRKQETQSLEELFVKDVGNPVPVTEMFGSRTDMDIEYSVEERKGETTVRFSIDVAAYPAYRTSLAKGSTVWLICAFSESDDFDHHSRMRKHIQVIL